MSALGAGSRPFRFIASPLVLLGLVAACNSKGSPYGDLTLLDGADGGSLSTSGGNGKCNPPSSGVAAVTYLSGTCAMNVGDLTFSFTRNGDGTTTIDGLKSNETASDVVFDDASCSLRYKLTVTSSTGSSSCSQGLTGDDAISVTFTSSSFTGTWDMRILCGSTLRCESTYRLTPRTSAGTSSDAGGTTGNGSGSSGSTAWASCSAYYRAWSAGGACQLCVQNQLSHCESLQTAASCTPAELSACENQCGWSGSSANTDNLCTCISSCLGSCRSPNDDYFTCETSPCASLCP